MIFPFGCRSEKCRHLHYCSTIPRQYCILDTGPIIASAYLVFTKPAIPRRSGFFSKSLMRTTIAFKLATAAIMMVVLCLGTMAWVTSRNIENGFISYLNELQQQHLDQVKDILTEQYRARGNFDWLRRNPRALSDLIAQRNGDIHPEADDPPPRREDPAEPPPPRREDDFPVRPARPDRPRPALNEDAPLPLAPPAARRPPPADPFGFGPRLSLHDADGRPVIGPPKPGPGLVRTIEVGGQVVGTLTLTPLREIPAPSAVSFVRGQIHDILWLASGLLLLSALAAVWLARRMLRPVAALRKVTESIARGKLDARAPLIGRDELADLAEHVNAMAESLETNEQQRRKMLADVSHELRTPLAVIRGEIEALLDGIRVADAKALASLHHEVLRLNKLVDDLYQLTLADSGDLHYQRRRVDLVALAGDLTAGFEARAAKAGLQLLYRVPQYAVTVLADADRLAQVLTNLLENSIRYTDAGGSIVLSVRADGLQAEISIEDSAPGVPDEARRLLFERLYRVDQARSRSRGGSGLGLSICKSLVEAHGGTIVALPSTLGGLKMLIRLPLSNMEDR
jgi:two-component system sensor histidine kinase BaeS